MGTRMDIVFWGKERRYAQWVFQEILTEVNRLESLLTRFDERSIISRVNANAGLQPVAVPAEIFEILSECIRYGEITNGLFDITALPLIRFFKSRNEKKSAKPVKNVESAVELVGYEKLRLNRENLSVYPEKKGMQIDLGGVGKGVALEHIDNILEKKEIQNAFISFGESSILAKGRHPYGDCWKLGIRHIHDTGRNVYSFDLKNTSLSTSGITSLTLKDIVHPKTGEFPEITGTISVTSSSPVEAEILSTTLLLAKREEQSRILKILDPEKAVQINYPDEQPEIRVLYQGSDCHKSKVPEKNMLTKVNNFNYGSR